jgi:hypothetical protein
MSWNPAADLSYAGKQEVLLDYWQRFGPFKFVIETGIWQGRGSCMEFRSSATEYVGIEVDNESAAQARADGWDVRTGDSAHWLPVLLASRNAPAFFWLDAHLVAEAGEENHSPLIDELAAILGWPHAAESVVLVDDVRMMGRDGWPTIVDVLQRVGIGHLGTWDADVRADILRLTPR